MSEEQPDVAVAEVVGGEEEEDADVSAMLDLTKKKKKKKSKTTTTTATTTSTTKDGKGSKKDAATAATATTATSSSTSGTPYEELQRQLLMEYDAQQEEACRDEDDVHAEYTYDVLLDKVVDLLHANNPDLVEKKRTRIKPPQLQMIGSRKTLWVNFQEICTMMQRDAQHVYSFLMAELGTEGSIDGQDRLIIRGRYLPKYIESLLRKYVVEYVTCEMCRSPNTDLIRDQSSRLYFVNCRDCGSKRSVATVRTGYHATSRADRRAARNAKG
jgi:translation initiation factor 2 subunit 2